jgi:hypothetical protein
MGSWERLRDEEAAGSQLIRGGTMGLAGIGRFGSPPVGYGLPY